jgi:hypothetical protein
MVMIHSGHEKKAPGIISVTPGLCPVIGAEVFRADMPKSMQLKA